MEIFFILFVIVSVPAICIIIVLKPFGITTIMRIITPRRKKQSEIATLIDKTTEKNQTIKLAGRLTYKKLYTMNTNNENRQTSFLLVFQCETSTKSFLVDRKEYDKYRLGQKGTLVFYKHHFLSFKWLSN